jgi:hypothetical protein
VETLLGLVKSMKHLNKVKVLITSRPEPFIQRIFNEISEDEEIHYNLALQMVDNAVVSRDISVFINYELKNIWKRGCGLTTNWPGEEAIEELTQKSGCLFNFAAIVCSYIRGPGSKATSRSERLRQVLEGEGRAAEGLDKMYTQILLQSIMDEKDSELLTSQIRQILGVVVTLFKSVPAMVLGELCPIDLEKVWDRLDSLKSVLVVPDSESTPIRIFHTSFATFSLTRGDIQTTGSGLMTRRHIETCLTAAWNSCRLTLKEISVKFITRALESTRSRAARSRVASQSILNMHVSTGWVTSNSWRILNENKLTYVMAEKSTPFSRSTFSIGSKLLV